MVTCVEQKLSHLVSLITHIRSLNLTIWHDSFSVCRICSSLSNLSFLQIRFASEGASSVRGSDLLLLAQSCPNLTVLVISDWDSYIPHGDSDITDTLIDQVAKCLPKLKRIELFLEDITLSERSVIALVRHCPLLRECLLTAVFDLGVLFTQDLRGLLS